MTACPRCSASLPGDARFCPSCGLSLATGFQREERRVVTVLFADLVGFTAFSDERDPEDVKRIIDRAFEGLAEIVTVYGGSVDKILGDEIMAVFGAPQAHEDDPERAVRCALEMQRSLETYARSLESERGLTMAMRVGVNTGEVVAGAIGGGDVYTVVGDAVNIASRFVKEAEPGAILVGQSTRAATERSIEYRDPIMLTLKGKAEPLSASHAIAERAGSAGPRSDSSGRDTAPPLVGRAPELGVIEGIASIVVRDRKSAAVTILGDAGMGKTRLVAEFAARLGGARVLWGRSLPYGTASPAFALEEMIRSAFDDPQEPAASDTAMLRKRILEGLEGLGLLAESERVLSLAGVREHAAARRTPGPTGAGPASGAAARGDLAVAQPLFEALAAREPGGLVLVFQELHWAEQTLIEVIGEMLERSRDVPLLIVALGRPELLARTAAWPVRSGSTVLHLLPLPRSAAAELLDALAGDQLHPSVRENVLDRAGGNPFFLEEFVRLSLDAGSRGGAAVPVSVQALVAARLDQLDPTVRRVAQDAAVVGETFWPDALCGIDDAAGDTHVHAAIEDLRVRELVELVEGGAHPMLPGRSEYRFRQTIVREVAYNALPKQARATRHASVARWLEQVSADGGLERDFVDLVAHHYERAAASAREVGMDATVFESKAREYLERAGDESMGVDAAHAAALFYERALEFARDPVDALHLRVHLGEAFVGSWNPAKAEAHLTQALTDARNVGDRRLEGKALRLLGDLERIRGSMELSRQNLEQALVIAREQGDAREEAEGMRSHGLLDLLSGRVPASPLWFRQALARYRELEDKRGEGWCLQNLGWANLMLGRIDEALEMLEEGAAVFTELHDMEGIGWCLGLRSWALLFQGRIDEADDLGRELMALAGTVQETQVGMGGMGIEIERVLRAIVATQRLRFSDAILMATATFAAFEESGSNWGQAMARFPIGTAQLARREVAAARATLEEARGYAQRGGDPLVLGLLQSALAYAEKESGNLDRAEELAVGARELMVAAGVAWHTEVSAQWLIAEIAVARGDLDAAAAALEPVLGMTSSSLMPAPRAHALYAQVLRMQGRAGEAVKVAREAIVAAGSWQMEATWGRRALVAALLDDDRAAEALSEAQAALALLEPTEWRDEIVKMLTLCSRALDELGRHDEAAEMHDRARALIEEFPAEADTVALVGELSG